MRPLGRLDPRVGVHGLHGPGQALRVCERFEQVRQAHNSSISRVYTSTASCNCSIATHSPTVWAWSMLAGAEHQRVHIVLIALGFGAVRDGDRAPARRSRDRPPAPAGRPHRRKTGQCCCCDYLQAVRLRPRHYHLHRLLEAGVRHRPDVSGVATVRAAVTLVAVSPSLITRLKPLVGGSKSGFWKRFPARGRSAPTPSFRPEKARS